MIARECCEYLQSSSNILFHQVTKLFPHQQSCFRTLLLVQEKSTEKKRPILSLLLGVGGVRFWRPVLGFVVLADGRLLLQRRRRA